MTEPTCPTCGNNRQVWANQISGEKVCHRAGCHAIVSPHPLAVEAAEKISKMHQEWFYQDEEPMPDMAPIIHTTALEPVIKAGEEMADALLALRPNHSNNCDERCGACYVDRKRTQWRTLTALKTAPQNPLGGSKSDLEAKIDSGERKVGL